MPDARDNERAGYGFTRKDHKRVSDVVRRAQGSAVGGNPAGGQGYPGRRRTPVIPGAAQVIAVYTPVGGIPAATGSPPNVTCGAADCQPMAMTTGGVWGLAGGGGTVNVLNTNSLAGGAVGGHKIVFAIQIGAAWQAVWEPC